MKNKNFVAVIPARSGSQELKNKNIINMRGHPLLSYSIQAAKDSKFINKIFVTTDKKKIATISKLYGAEVVFRPKKLSGNGINIEPAVNHLIKSVEKNHKISCDYIVLLQPTSPLRNPKDLDNAIEIFLREKCDSLFSSVNFHSLYWRKKKKQYKPINYNFCFRPNRQKMSETLIENGSIYVTKKGIYKKKGDRLGGKISTYIMDNYSIFEIDSKKDMKIVSDLIASKNLKKKICKPKIIK